ncbi:cbb3-type cytochrome oxidase subunit 3 [Noviherbaspirillum denitrificans]|uniref:Cytochrome C oxidase Cbb3 n=1 Tax=Noviherbaspirillum denitrificans TaxID=1968433 RepID=A0A254TPL6_9BURK|nr:cbb3-type cytochrome c oxidase subunit 3 [Noviherbaspirillum denitrificans]OWW21678.1 cytochrome C oxidase Cbb3 [Noviherbaspirillum denitrificans]
MNFESLIFDARNVMTVLSFLTFIGIVWWAYSGRRSADFEAAANLPFADEQSQAAEKQHG